MVEVSRDLWCAFCGEKFTGKDSSDKLDHHHAECMSHPVNELWRENTALHNLVAHGTKRIGELEAELERRIPAPEMITLAFSREQWVSLVLGKPVVFSAGPVPITVTRGEG